MTSKRNADVNVSVHLNVNLNIGGHFELPIGKILAIFYLQVTPILPIGYVNWILAIFDLEFAPVLPIKFWVSIGFSVQEKFKIDFQDCSRGGHLGFPIGMILAILASDHNYFSITFRTKTSWEKNADNFAIDAYFLLLMSSFLTFKFIHFTHDHDQLLFLLSSVKVNTCQFIPVTAHVGSLLRGVLRFTCFPEIKRKQNKLLIFKTPTCWSIKRITVK